MSNTPHFIGAGIAWYKRTDYPRILEIMEDTNRLPITFDRWQKAAEKTETNLRRSGKTPVRVHLDPEEFLAWCRASGLNVDAKARITWAADYRRWPRQ